MYDKRHVVAGSFFREFTHSISEVEHSPEIGKSALFQKLAHILKNRSEVRAAEAFDLLVDEVSFKIISRFYDLNIPDLIVALNNIQVDNGVKRVLGCQNIMRVLYKLLNYFTFYAA